MMKSRHLLLALALTSLAITIASTSVAAADSVADKVDSVQSKATQAIQEAGDSAKASLDKYWRRIDEKRLKNRTGDQIVAWAIVGTLVAAVINRFTKLNRFTTLLLGLTGAFIGGIVENLVRLDFGMGPVLISYEELLASLLGGVLLILLVRALASRKKPKAS
jgi:uncharacterized membrane protein YeaQ/YmgE (transglycosylase-associated protein family)